MAAKDRPLDRARAFFDVLLADAAVVIQGDETLHRLRQVGDDKADLRKKLTRMPLDLGNHSSALCR